MEQQHIVIQELVKNKISNLSYHFSNQRTDFDEMQRLLHAAGTIDVT